MNLFLVDVHVTFNKIIIFHHYFGCKDERTCAYLRLQCFAKMPIKHFQVRLHIPFFLWCLHISVWCLQVGVYYITKKFTFIRTIAIIEVIFIGLKKKRIFEKKFKKDQKSLISFKKPFALCALWLLHMHGGYLPMKKLFNLYN